MVGYLMTEQEQAEDLLRTWQRRLRLQDWDIVVHVKRRTEMPEGYFDCDGCCISSPLCRQSAIYIRSADDHEDENFLHDLEQILVHELLEVHFSFLDLDSNEASLIVKENAIDLLSKAFVKAYRGHRV